MSTIFLSYCWNNTDIAERIDRAFQPTGIILQRDIHTLKYKDSIKSYMQKIRTADFALMLLSDDFLKSTSCMFEVLEVLKERDFRDKILPIYVNGTKFFKPADRIFYIKYWQDEYDALSNKLVGVDTLSAIDLYLDLKHVKTILDTIGEFFAILSDMNLLSSDELIKSNFKPIFEHLGVSDKILIDKILSLKRLEDIEDVEIELENLEKEYPNNARVAFVKASTFFDNKQNKKAIHFYRKAIELDPTFSPSYYNLAYQLDFFEHNYIEAAELYRKAIELAPDNTRAMVNLGRLYSLELNDVNQARAYYEKALDINPMDGTSRHNLAALIHREFDDLDVALTLYESVLEIDPNVDSFFAYGLLLWKSYSRLQEAECQFKLALDLDPNNKLVLQQLGKLHEYGLNDIKSAKPFYDHFITMNPSAADHHFYYTFLLAPEFEDKYIFTAKKHYEMASSLNSSYESDVMKGYFGLNDLLGNV